MIEKLPQAAVDVRQGLGRMVGCLPRVFAAALKHCFVLQAQQEEMWLEFFFLLEWGKLLASGQAEKCGMDLDQTFFFFNSFFFLTFFNFWNFI